MMPFDDIAFQLVDLPPLSEPARRTWSLTLSATRTSSGWCLDGEQVIEGSTRRGVCSRPETSASTRPARSRATSRRRPEEGADRCHGPRQARRCRFGPVVEELLEGRWRAVGVSARSGAGLRELARRTFEAFEIMRVYTKQPGKPRDDSTPFALPRVHGRRSRGAHPQRASRHHDVRTGVGTSAFDGQAVRRTSARRRRRREIHE